MSIAARARLRRAFARVSAAAAILAIVGLLGFLPFAGRFLVRQDPLIPSDAILVLAGGTVDRWLEGVELYREGHAPIIVLSPGRLDRAEIGVRAKGIRWPSAAELALDAIPQLGVPPAVVQIMPGNLDNTAEEAAAFHQLVNQKGWRSAIVVTSPYHTRRTRIAFRREFRGMPVALVIRASRFDESDPPRWWRHRADIRFVVSELPKVLLYGLGLGG
ncbi:MAG: YdcF family protein [Vicinamibacterales bacterium]